MGLLLGLTSMNHMVYPAFISFLIGMPTAILNNKRNLKVFIKIFLAFFIFYIGSLAISNNLIF